MQAKREPERKACNSAAQVPHRFHLICHTIEYEKLQPHTK